jgi:predicted transcriptional regulator
MPRKTGARPIDQILNRREQQIMDVIHVRGRASAADIYEDLPDAPSYNAVRGVLRLLLDKGHVLYERDGRRFVYRAKAPARRTGQAAVRHVLHTFFGGSTAELVNTLFAERTPSVEELDRLAALVHDARRRQDGKA